MARRAESVAVLVPAEVELNRATRTNDTAPSFKLLDTVTCAQREHESVFEAAERLLLEEVLYQTGGDKVRTRIILGKRTPLKARALSKTGYLAAIDRETEAFKRMLQRHGLERYCRNYYRGREVQESDSCSD